MKPDETPSRLPGVEHYRKDDVEGWHDVLCRAFSRTSNRPRARGRFEGELTYMTQGPVRMSRIRSSPGYFTRQPDAIRSDSFDGFMVLHSLRGDLRIAQNGKTLVAHKGEALLYRQGSPFELEFPDRYHAVSLWVPPDLLQRHCPVIANQTVMVIRPDTTNGALALTMVRELCANADTKAMAGAARLVGATLDVMSTIATSPDTGESAQESWVIGKLTDYLERNFDDAELSLDRLVDEAGVSARTLNRVFARIGTTPMRWVRDQRLQMAYDALSGSRVRNVTEAAYSFGFKDSSHFSHAFTRKFGVPPNTILGRT